MHPFEKHEFLSIGRFLLHTEVSPLAFYRRTVTDDVGQILASQHGSQNSKAFISSNCYSNHQILFTIRLSVLFASICE